MASNPRRIIRLSPEKRFELGLTATVAEQATGEVRTRVFAGTTRPVEALAAWLDALGSAWKVRTLSTPATVHADLVNDGHERAQQVEAFMLNRIGRGDLVERANAIAGTGRVNASRRRRA